MFCRSSKQINRFEMKTQQQGIKMQHDSLFSCLTLIIFDLVLIEFFDALKVPFQTILNGRKKEIQMIKNNKSSLLNHF